MLLLTAPTSLGNRPYEDDGTARLTTLGPQRLREQQLVARLGARDLGDVAAAPYRDFVRPPGGIRNEDLIVDHVRAVAASLEPHDEFTLVLGGDCSVLLGSLLGLGHGRELALVFVDAHSDFNTPELSGTGGAAGMDLALATGRGDSPLARLGGGPLVREEHVIAVGVREGDFAGSGIHTAASAAEVLDQLGGRPFFVHVDTDVLDPRTFPFVDSPAPGGLSPRQLAELLTPLVRHPLAVGMELTIYDPRDDHDGRGARLLADLLCEVFGAEA
jgi:arginase